MEALVCIHEKIEGLAEVEAGPAIKVTAVERASF